MNLPFRSCSFYTAIIVSVFAVGLHAQVSNPQIQFTTSDPTGNVCSNTRIQVKTPDGTLYTCQSGHMAAFTPATFPSGSGVVKVTSGSPGVVSGTSSDCVKVDGSSGGCGSATSGTTGQALTSNGSGGFGTPVTLAPSATTDTTNATNVTSGKMGIGRVASGTPDGTQFVRDDGTLAPPIGSPTGTGIWCSQGGTSGQICMSVSKIAGANVGYLYPDTGPVGTQMMVGYSISCPDDWVAPPGVTLPTTCYRMAWQDIPTGGTGGTLSTPTFSPVSGTYSTFQSVAISNIGAAVGCCTIDGSTPAAAVAGTCSHGATGATTSMVGSGTLSCLATQSGAANSGVGTSAYVITPLAAPTAAPPAGSYSSTQSVALSGPSGATI